MVKEEEEEMEAEEVEEGPEEEGLGTTAKDLNVNYVEKLVTQCGSAGTGLIRIFRIQIDLQLMHQHLLPLLSTILLELTLLHQAQ